MAGNASWASVPLASVAEILSGGTPSTSVPRYWRPEIDWVTAKDVSECQLAKIHQTERRISREGLENCPARILPALTTVLIARGATMGKCRMIARPMAMNQTCYGIVAKSGNDARYLYYYLSNAYETFRSMAHGSVFDTVIGSSLRSLPVHIPPLPVQRRIAEILGRLDDKIEVNRRISQTLEAMAQALYRHWFVEFGPFQDGEFVESELGVIPKGWEISSLAELLPDHRECVITGPFGTNLHASDYREEGTPLILVNSVMNGRINEDGLPLVGNHKLAELRRYVLEVGDIVVTRVGVVGNSAYIHPRQSGWMVSGQMLRVRLPSNGRLNPRYLAQTYLTKSFVTSVENNAVGSTRPSLNTEIWKSLPFLVPPIEAQEEFASIVKSADEESENLRLEINALASIRDYLLPKLMSGEVNAAIQM
jgi:type I restriction enzyme S subunit